MQRSRINAIQAEAQDFMAAHGINLPPFAHWTPDQMRERATAAICHGRLGWDITDYGQGDFDRLGLFLFTLRNGSQAELAGGAGRVYAEKLLISQDRQISPMHTHRMKTEDIINRAGAVLAIRLVGSDDQGRMDRKTGTSIECDGITRQVAPGDVIRLRPGESVTLRPGDWHEFWAEGGPCLIGEVSTVNDDLTDNIFAAPIGRFAEINEDQPPVRLLVSDYDRFLTT